MRFTVEYEQEEDGRWLAEVKELPGVLTYMARTLMKPSLTHRHSLCV
jgi:predicted RNase H-like HicB family nuclease